MLGLSILAQAGDEGFHLPGGPGEWVVWLVFAVIVGGLWFLVRRTRRRAQQEFYERKRREEAERRRLLGED